MTTNDAQTQERQALEHLLEVYGADRTRWPARERLRFAPFIGDDVEARRLVAEASALDSLLDLAPRAGEDRERALQERIVAAALRSVETKLAVVAENGARLPVRARLASVVASVRKAPVRREWPAAGLLAASLVLGVFLGSAGTLDATVQEVAEVTGLASAGDSSQLALGEEIVAFAEEDIL